MSVLAFSICSMPLTPPSLKSTRVVVPVSSISFKELLMERMILWGSVLVSNLCFSPFGGFTIFSMGTPSPISLAIESPKCTWLLINDGDTMHPLASISRPPEAWAEISTITLSLMRILAFLGSISGPYSTKPFLMLSIHRKICFRDIYH